MRRLRTALCLVISFCCGTMGVGQASSYGLAVQAHAATIVPAPAAKPSIFQPGPANRTATGQVPSNRTDKLDSGRELLGLRTRTSRTIMTRQGYESFSYPHSINYLDSGAWKPIDTSLAPSAGGGYRNRANGFDLELPGDLKAGPISIAKDGESVAYRLLGAAGRGAVNDSTDTYAGVLPGTTVTIISESDGVKETLALAGSNAPSSFDYNLQLSQGLSAQPNKAGGIDFVKLGANAPFSFAPPTVTDAAGASGSVILQLVSPTDVRLVVDKAWLHQPGRQWPITVDPTVTISYSGSSIVKSYSGANQDCYLYSASPSTSFCNGTTLNAGYNGTGVERAVMEFNISVPQDANVLEADLAVQLSARSASASAVELHPVTQAWTTAATWNKADGTNSWSAAGGAYSNPATWTTTVGTATGTYHWYLTALAQSWVNGSAANNGILLRATSETTNDELTFSSSESHQSSTWPVLRVIYQLGIGERPYYKMETQQLTDRLSIETNVSSGNLVAHLKLVNIKGTGLDAVFDLLWNVLSPSLWDFGRAWISNTGWDPYVDPNMGDGASFFGPGGWAFHFMQNADGTYATPGGVDATLTHNQDGTYTVTFHATGEKYNFTSNGLTMTSDVDRNGNTIRFAYDANGAVSSMTDTQGRVTTFGYVTGSYTHCGPPSASGFVSTITDPVGRKHQFTYDANCDLTSYTDPNNKVTNLSYDSLFNLIKITDPLGNQTKFTYDSVYRVTSVIRVTNVAAGTGPTTTFGYNSGSTVVTDPDGNQTTYTYDSRDRVTQTSDAGGSTYRTYSSDSKLLTEKDKNGNQTAYVYDSKNNQTSQQFAGGATTTAAYSDSNHPYQATTRTDDQGNSRSLAYDTKGNLASVGPSGSNPTSITHNGNGEPSTVVDPNSGTTTLAYDPYGNLTLITYPSPGGTWSYTYDSLGRLTTATDPKSQVATYSYDAFDRITRVAYSGGSSVTYVFDADGNRLTMVDATGTTTWSYDPLNRVSSELLPTSQSVSYGYDGDSHLTSRTDSGGTEQRTYNSLNELLSITDPSGKVTSFQYDASGRNTQIGYPNGVTEVVGYNAGAQPASIAATGPGSTALTSFAYTFTNPASGQNTAKRYSVVDLSGNTTSYQYDSQDRLTSAVKKSSGGTTLATYQYSYDNLGNLLTRTINGAPTSFTYNGANELTQEGTTTFSYDANGNQTGSSLGAAESYNGPNQMASATPAGQQPISMVYTGTGQAKRVSAGSTTFQYDLTGLSVLTSSGASTYFSHFTNGAPLFMRQGGATYYYLHDSMGSVVGVTNSSGQVVNSYSYDPYGSLTSSVEAVSNPLKWIGAVFDSATGLYQMGERYYSPDQGRFLQRDPAFLPGTNSYSYADGDPINRMDPSGLYWYGFYWWGIDIYLNQSETNWLDLLVELGATFFELIAAISMIFVETLWPVVVAMIAILLMVYSLLINWLNGMGWGGIWIGMGWDVVWNWGGWISVACNGCWWSVPVWV